MNKPDSRRIVISVALLALATAQSIAPASAHAQPAAPQTQGASTTWAPQTSAAGPPARYGAGAAYDESSQSVILFGGGSSLHQAEAYADTWSWDGSRWTELHPDASPTARAYPSVAADAASNGVLLFGGLGGDQGSANPDNETWTWDGANWTQQQPDVSPPSRGAASLAADGRGGMVLFGGTTYVAGGAVFDDTWTWDGTTWTQQHPATSPPARAGASMAPDGHGGVVLFGGTNSPYLFQAAPGSAMADVWTWDGTNWTQQHPSTSPSARWDASMAYDPAFNGAVLIGGDSGRPNAGSNEMWTWDGISWTRQQPAAGSGPFGRAGAAMAYDTAVGGLVIVGGRDTGPSANSRLLGDTWTWSGSAPAASAAPAAPTPAGVAPQPPGAAGGSVPNISKFVGTWTGHQRRLEVHVDGSATMLFGLSGEPGVTLTLQLTSATPSVATGQVVASDSPFIAVGQAATLTLMNDGTLSPTIGGQDILGFCGPQAPVGYCGA